MRTGGSPRRWRSWQIGGALAAAALVLVFDPLVPYVDFGPLMLLPVIAIAIAGGGRPAIALALVLAAGSAIVEHRVLDRSALVNALVIALEMLVAIALVQRWRFERASAQGLTRAAQDAFARAQRSFVAETATAEGWRFSIVRADPTACASVADVRERDGGVDLFVTDVAAAAVHGAMILAAVRSALPAIRPLAPQARLTKHNEHLRPICARGVEVRALDARLSAGGAVRLASAGFAAVLVARGDGRVESTRGGGLPLGRFVEAYVDEALVVLEDGDALVVMDDRMRALTTDHPAIVERLIAGDASLRDELLQRHGPQIGLAIVASRIAAAAPVTPGRVPARVA